mmetsp:Transcript_11248/g.35887  ORF Transcript_11248/g.35887 Transcript_11248/m.35887 type:complete len:332 (-) Transcript_11248:59-1054(-)
MAGALEHVALRHGALVAHVRRDLAEQHRVRLRVGQVGGEVGHAARVVGVLEMEVDPAQQDVLRGQLEQVRQLLALVLVQQPHQLGVLLQIDGGQQLDLHDLPHKAQHEMGCLHAVHHVVRADVDHHTADRLGRVQRQVQVLVDLVNVQVPRPWQVERALVDRLRHRLVDQFAEQHAVAHTREEIHAVWIQRQHRQLRVSLERVVDVLCEGALLSVRERVLGAALALHLEQRRRFLDHALESRRAALPRAVAHALDDQEELVELDGAALIDVHRSNQRVHLRAAQVFAQGVQNLDHFVSVDGTVAVLVKRAEAAAELGDLLRCEVPHHLGWN